VELEDVAARMSTYCLLQVLPSPGQQRPISWAERDPAADRSSNRRAPGCSTRTGGEGAGRPRWPGASGRVGRRVRPDDVSMSDGFRSTIGAAATRPCSVM